MSQFRKIDPLRVWTWDSNGSRDEATVDQEYAPVDDEASVDKEDAPTHNASSEASFQPASPTGNVPSLAEGFSDSQTHMSGIEEEQWLPDEGMESPSVRESVREHDQALYDAETDTDSNEGDAEDDRDDLFIATDEAVNMPRESQPLTLIHYLEDLESDSDDADTLSNPTSPSPSPSPSAYETSDVSPAPPLAPPPLPSPAGSPTPSYEVLQQGGKGVFPPPLHLALGLWLEKSGCSRTDYVRLREVLMLQKASAAGGNTSSQDNGENEDEDEDQTSDLVQTLPLKLDTLKRQIRRHIPLLQLMRKPLTVALEKQPSLPQGEKGRQRIERLAWQYWYDPLDLVRTILSATRLRQGMFFGMAHYVDEPTELWESNAWGSSIRTTSGDVCYAESGAMIIPGDLVRISCPPYKIGRVLFIGRDYRSNTAIQGEVVITVQAIAEQRHIQTILHEFDLEGDAHEVFLLEDVFFEVDSIERHLEVYLDREYDEDDEDMDEIIYDGYYLRRVLNIQFLSVRPLRQLHSTRGELEVAYFGRDKLQQFASKPHLSLPYFMFIDDFGVHRNMYRALKAFYLIPACLSYSERRKLANVFTLSLGPHGASIEDVVEAFYRPIQILDAGTTLEINGVQTAVWSFTMTFLGDMPQQADNAGFMRHNANMGCRTCFCPKEERSNLDFDTEANGRYHFETLQQRIYAESLSGNELRTFLREKGLRPESPAVTKLAPSLDLIQSRPYDAPHSEWRGLGRILLGFLMTSILSKRGSISFLKAFQDFRFPPGWARIQSPMHYIWSWSLSEAGKATLLTPLILRTHATTGWFRLQFLQAVNSTMNIESSPFRAIIKAFGIIARSNTLVGSQRYTDPAVLHGFVLEARRAYHELISCAGVVVEGFGRRDDSDGGDEGGDNGALETILSDAALSDSVADVPPQARARRRGRQPKANKFQKLLGLPNVHAGLHLADNAKEYATVMNSNVLAGELKHKTFKGMADTASPPNLMGYLFAKDVMMQSLRLGLAGAWDHDHPEMYEALLQLNTECPALVRSFLPVSEQLLDEAEADESPHGVVEDIDHRFAQLSVKGFVLDTTHFRLKANTNLMKLPPQHNFVQHLMAAYRQEYRIRVVDLGTKLLKWYRRIAFTDVHNRRYVYNVNDYLRIAGIRGRLSQCFIHTYQRKKYAFFVVYVYSAVQVGDATVLDPVLDLPVFSRKGAQQHIYGLPMVGEEPLYMVEVPEEPEWLSEGRNDYALECTWGVAYL